MRPDLQRLQAGLGYEFRDVALLERALTHRSANRRHNNERLEFLGDAQLSQIISRWLFTRFDGATEGQLTRMRASLVRGQTLAELARELGIGEFLVLGGGEMKSGGHRRASILADALEAIIGAILLDGGEQRCRRVVEAWFASRLEAVSPATIEKDAKTRLQEWLQGHQRGLPQYEVEAVHGQAPNQRFDVRCILAGFDREFRASGRSRRQAEQQAAEVALAWLEGGEVDET